jgi:hypothetical protein
MMTQEVAHQQRGEETGLTLEQPIPEKRGSAITSGKKVREMHESPPRGGLSIGAARLELVTS